jgi:predicted nucleic acid-binding protein
MTVMDEKKQPSGPVEDHRSKPRWSANKKVDAVLRLLRGEPLDDEVLGRAFEVQGVLAERSQHRLPIPDLVIAAAAESAGLTVLHYDADFERIAEVTGQEQDWVVPRGSV